MNDQLPFECDKEKSDSVVVTIDKSERWQIKKKAKVLKFRLNSNALSLSEYCQITGRTPDFRLKDRGVIAGYHEALFEIYDNMQVVARMWPEDEDIYFFL